MKYERERMISELLEEWSFCQLRLRSLQVEPNGSGLVVECSFGHAKLVMSFKHLSRDI